MKVALINIINNPLGNIIENLGIASIASFLREHSIDVDLKSVDSRLLTEGYIQKNLTAYDIYGFPFYADNAKGIFDTAKIIKKLNPKAKVFVGGRFATETAELILEDCSYINYVVLGDGEYPVLDMVNCIIDNKDVTLLEHVKTRNDITAKKPFVVDIHDMPYPSRDILVDSLNKGNFTALITGSRGCCGNCSFCSANSYNHKWQGKDINDIFNEIISLHENYGVRSFLITDNSLEDPGILGKQRIFDLCNLLINYPVKLAFKCYLRAETFTSADSDLIKIMKKAGFTQVFIGLEAANDSDLKIYNKKATKLDNQNAIDLFTANEIEVIFGFIMFNPFSTKETVKENYYFLKKNKSYNIADYTSRIQLYYNTDLYFVTKVHDLLKPEYNYLTPYNYFFQDEWVNQINEFMSILFETYKISSYDFDLVAYVNIISYINAIYLDKSEKYVKEFYSITDEISELLAQFFELVYIDCNLKKAETSFETFLESIIPLYEKIKRLILTVMKKFQLSVASSSTN